MELPRKNPNDGSCSKKKKRIPPGWHWQPTDEQLMSYLICKNNGQPFDYTHIILDVNLYGDDDPTALTEKYKAQGKSEWYFFTKLKQKGGSMPSRRAGNGFWKASGQKKEIKSDDGRKLGERFSLCYNFGRQSDEASLIKTSWLMNEYRLPKGEEKVWRDEFVLAKIYISAHEKGKNTTGQENTQKVKSTEKVDKDDHKEEVGAPNNVHMSSEPINHGLLEPTNDQHPSVGAPLMTTDRTHDHHGSTTSAMGSELFHHSGTQEEPNPSLPLMSDHELLADWAYQDYTLQYQKIVAQGESQNAIKEMQQEDIKKDDQMQLQVTPYIQEQPINGGNFDGSFDQQLLVPPPLALKQINGCVPIPYDLDPQIPTYSQTQVVQELPQQPWLPPKFMNLTAQSPRPLPWSFDHSSTMTYALQCDELFAIFKKPGQPSNCQNSFTQEEPHTSLGQPASSSMLQNNGQWDQGFKALDEIYKVDPSSSYELSWPSNTPMDSLDQVVMGNGYPNVDPCRNGPFITGRNRN